MEAVLKRLRRLRGHRGRDADVPAAPGDAVPAPDPPFLVDQSLTAKADYDRLRLAMPALFDAETEAKIVRHVMAHGVQSRFLGYVGAEQIAIIGTELREHLHARGLNSRQRLMLDLAIEALRESSLPEHDARIYCHEAITPFALLMRGRFPKMIGTEFLKDAASREAFFPILHGDVCRSDFPSDAFDLILSNDVLEHVPELDDALREAARILKPGGSMLATFPFFFDREVGIRFASLLDGRVVHHVEPPVYHGNPVDPEGGSLVFQIPGWDVIARARSAGFSDARMRLVCDQDRGICASFREEETTPKGVFVACFRK